MSDPIVVERLIAAPPSVVYSYLTSSEKWARWQGIDANVQPENGGQFAVSMPNGTSARGEFLELQPDERVVFTWGWVDHPEIPPGSTTVEIDLIGEGGGTRLRLTHRGLPPDEVSIHTAGWEHYTIRARRRRRGSRTGPGHPGTLKPHPLSASRACAGQGACLPPPSMRTATTWPQATGSPSQVMITSNVTGGADAEPPP